MPLPDDPKEIAQQIDANLAARDALELQKIRAGLGSRVFEFFLLAGLFAFSIGVAVTIIFAIPQDNEALYYFICMFLLALLGWVLMALEYLIRRHRVLRRLEEMHLRRLERLERALRELQKNSSGKGRLRQDSEDEAADDD